MKKGTIVAIVLAVCLVFTAVTSTISTCNSFVKKEESINTAAADILLQLERRADLIPNLVSIVKEYVQCEEQVYTDIAQAKAALLSAQGMDEKVKANAKVESALGRLLAITENYPELKSNENFTRLQDELAGTESRIAVAKTEYNDNVKNFNTTIKTFPESVIAKFMKLEQKPYFETKTEV